MRRALNRAGIPAPPKPDTQQTHPVLGTLRQQPLACRKSALWAPLFASSPDPALSL